MMYPESKTVFDSFESFDRGIYRVNKWSPEYEFKVGPGQCVIFPPGYMHETYVNPEENDECTVASTFQYNIPFPVKYIRAWLPRLYNSHLVWAEDCHSRWEAFHSFQYHKFVPSLDTKVLQKRVDGIFKKVDKDKDGFLDFDELTKYFGHEPETSWARQQGYSWTRKIDRKKREEVQTELVLSRVGDTVVYNDVNDDKKISVQELFESTLQWNVLSYKYWKLRGLNARDPQGLKKAIDIEKKFNKDYRCKEGAKAGSCLPESYFKQVEAAIPNLMHVSAFQKTGEEARQENPFGGPDTFIGGVEEEGDEDEENDQSDGDEKDEM